MVESSQAKKIKVVVIGDGYIGKTCLVTAYGTNQFPDECIPTVAAQYQNDVIYEDKNYTLEIQDTSGQDEYKNIRASIYNDADAVIVCFAMNDRNSLQNACGKWLTELKHAGKPKIVKILCGTKSDLFDNENKEHISFDYGSEQANYFKFMQYVECSAKTFNNLQTVFSEVIRLVELKNSSQSQNNAQDQEVNENENVNAKRCSCIIF